MNDVDAAKKAMRSLNTGTKASKRGEGMIAVAAGLRSLTWAVLYVGEQLKRQADFWETEKR